MAEQYDVVIVGGGLAGASLALALAKLPLRIALLEAKRVTTEIQTDYDARTVALSSTSQQILAGLQVWPAVAPFATPIAQIHISDRHHLGFTRLTAAEVQLPALGYVVPALPLNALLHQQLSAQSNVTLCCPARVQGLTYQNDHWQLTVQQAENSLSTLSAKLVVAADGYQSTVRQLLNIPLAVKEYGQTAVLANVTMAKPHQQIAFERFTQHGPIALLPLETKRYALIWAVANEQLAEWQALTESAFLARLQTYLGYRAGQFVAVGQRYTYPLKLAVTKPTTLPPQLILVGNAARHLHPIAGQGFNLALRDVAALAEQIAARVQQGGLITDPQILSHYQQQRQADQQAIVNFTHQLVSIFSNDWLPLAAMRNIGLLMLQNLPWARRQFIQRLLGNNGHLPKLACSIVN